MPALPGRARLGARHALIHPLVMAHASETAGAWDSDGWPDPLSPCWPTPRFQGEISPIPIVIALPGSTAGAGAPWGRGDWMPSIVGSASVPAPHLAMLSLGLPATLHPKALASLVLLAAFTFVGLIRGTAGGLLGRRPLTSRGHTAAYTQFHPTAFAASLSSAARQSAPVNPERTECGSSMNALLNSSLTLSGRVPASAGSRERAAEKALRLAPQTGIMVETTSGRHWWTSERSVSS